MRRRRKPKYEDPADAETQEIKRYSLIISMMPDTPLDLYEINASLDYMPADQCSLLICVVFCRPKKEAAQRR